MSENNSRHSWSSNPVLHFGNVTTYKSRDAEAIEYYEKQIEKLRENNGRD